MTDFAGKQILVAGEGVSGLGAKEALCRKGAFVSVYADGHPMPVGKWDAVVLSPAFAVDHFLYRYAKEQNIPIFGEYALGVYLNDKPLVAITGTNGKTTVTQMTAAVLSQKEKVTCCGNIGVSFAAEAAIGAYDVAVTEVSSFQLEQTPFVKPDLAVITNLTPDHLNRHKSMRDYAKAKYSLARYMSEEDTLFLPVCDPLYELDLLETGAKIEYVSAESKVDGAYLFQDAVYYKGDFVCRADKLPFAEKHLQTDALFAVAVGMKRGVPPARIVQGLQSFRLSDHRLHFVSCIDGVRFYDDSKSTNADSVIKALACMRGSVCLILCGSDKGLCYDEIFEHTQSVIAVQTVGQIADQVEESARRQGYDAVTCYDSLERAVIAAFLLRPDNVLLSPGSASFDRFSSYRERGEYFQSIVKEIEYGKA